jgi:HD-GYP domain-containing protein (c-di-GMP phosphodiesterase class II)
MKRSVLLYVTAIVAANILATIAVAIVGPSPNATDVKTSLFFSAIGLIAMLLNYQKSGSTSAGSGTSGSVSFLPFISGIVVSPTYVAPLSITVAALLVHVARRQSTARILFNASQFGIAASAAALVLVGHGRIEPDIGFDAERLALLCVASLLFIGINTLLVVGVISLSERRMFWPTWKRIISATILYDLLALPVIALLVVVYTKLGDSWLLVIILPLFQMRVTYKQKAELQRTADEWLRFTVSVIESQDPYTSGHSQRVTAYSRIIARIARIPAKEVDDIGTAAVLHDVGKIYPEFGPILKKPGRLTDEELAIIKTHPIRSAEMLEKANKTRLVAMVRAHHERWDGRGYPDGLAGQEIPLGARVIAIADTIDAMMSSRPYREGMNVADIRAEVERCRGTQFDPRLVDAVLTDVAWMRLSKAMRMYQNLRPGEIVPWDEDEHRRATGEMSVVASR